MPKSLFIKQIQSYYTFPNISEEDIIDNIKNETDLFEKNISRYKGLYHFENEKYLNLFNYSNTPISSNFIYENNLKNLFVKAKIIKIKDGDTFDVIFFIKNRDGKIYKIERSIRLLAFNCSEKYENSEINEKCKNIIDSFCDEDKMIYLHIKGFDIYGNNKNKGRLLAFAYKTKKNEIYNYSSSNMNYNLSFHLAHERLGNIVKSEWYNNNYF